MTKLRSAADILAGLFIAAGAIAGAVCILGFIVWCLFIR